jgi:predicted N-acetyltransferase YhbS
MARREDRKKFYSRFGFQKVAFFALEPLIAKALFLKELQDGRRVVELCIPAKAELVV